MVFDRICRQEVLRINCLNISCLVLQLVEVSLIITPDPWFVIACIKMYVFNICMVVKSKCDGGGGWSNSLPVIAGIG